MKYVFIVNPFAGKVDANTTLQEPIKAACEELGLDYEFRTTEGQGHAIKIAAEYADAATQEAPVRIFSVGGDGTLCETANGVLNRPYAELGAIPCGSGNDYIKMYGDKEQFLDFKNYIVSKSVVADAIKVTCGGIELNAINIASLGFDANICETTNQIKSKNKKLASRKAYNKAVMKCLFGQRYNELEVTINDEETFKGKYMFSYAACGQFYGSGMRSAPMADPCDGELEFMLVNTTSLIGAASMVGDYTSGVYYHKPNYQKMITHRFGRKMHAKSMTPTYVNIDGETFPCEEVTFELMPAALRFIVPQSFNGVDKVER